MYKNSKTSDPKPTVKEAQVLASGLTAAKEMEYEQLSPFEVTRILLEMANASCQKLKTQGKFCTPLNAGRGNPNFLNTTGRKAFAKLCLFATELAQMRSCYPSLGFEPEKQNIAWKLKEYLDHDATEEAWFLKNALDYAAERFGLDHDELVYELVNATLGIYYPEPPTILPLIGKIIYGYLTDVLMAYGEPQGRFDLFATEGATSGMVYTFHSLRINKILRPGDKIATITPIFAPYLEIPHLGDYELIGMEIKECEAMGWQIPDEELEKLQDKSIKVLYLVNPTNPTAVALHAETIDKIAEIVKTTRSDLLIVTDNVYATFVDDFYSLVRKVPHNTICLYSYSKYFGVTGWRLGVVFLHENNIVDQMLAALPRRDQAELAQRYRIVTAEPESLKFIERLEADSRDVALAHTGGISGPQQSMMCIFALFEMLDTEKRYKQSIKDTLERRLRRLYEALPVRYPFLKGAEYTRYYVLLNIKLLAELAYGTEFVKYLTDNFRSIDFLIQLAQEHAIVTLPGAGFSGPEWSLRISIANLREEDYARIGQAVMSVLASYSAHYREYLSKAVVSGEPAYAGILHGE